MLAQDIVDRLASMRVFESVPRAELEWLRARGEEQHYPPGLILRELGDSTDEMWILLAGRLVIYARQGGGWRKLQDSGPGNVLGAMPYSRMRVAPGRLVVEDESN